MNLLMALRHSLRHLFLQLLRILQQPVLQELTKVEVVKKQTIYTDNNANGATIAIGGIAKRQEV